MDYGHNPQIISKNQNNPHLTSNLQAGNIRKVPGLIIHGLYYNLQIIKISADYYLPKRSLNPHRVLCEMKDHLHRNVFYGFHNSSFQLCIFSGEI